ncbi:MAG: hypothetical protein V3R64_05230 [Sphingomonadales bacterium]
MPSSISSSDAYSYEDRPVPELPWKKALLLAVGLMVLATAGWEFHARVNWGYEAEDYIDSYGLWAIERRRVDAGEADVAVIGASRILYDLDLDTFEEMTGMRPVQIAMVGTNPRPFLTDLAADEDFKGLLILGITPGSFFRHEHGIFADVIDHYRDESPSEWISQQISVLIEPHLSFYDSDNWPLFTLLERAGLEDREGIGPPGFPVWKLGSMKKDRNTKLFWKVEDDRAYQVHAQMTWRAFMQRADAAGGPPPFDLDAYLIEVIADIEKIRARGGDVVFVRPPSAGDYRPRELRLQPRADYWDRLLRDTNSVGVHFEDHPELQGFRIPEWSHLHSEDAPKFTAAMILILDAKLKAAGKPPILAEEEEG